MGAQVRASTNSNRPSASVTVPNSVPLRKTLTCGTGVWLAPSNTWPRMRSCASGAAVGSAAAVAVASAGSCCGGLVAHDDTGCQPSNASPASSQRRHGAAGAGTASCAGLARMHTGRLPRRARNARISASLRRVKSTTSVRQAPQWRPAAVGDIAAQGWAQGCGMEMGRREVMLLR